MSLFSSTSIAVLSSCDTVMNEARRRFEAGIFPVNASVISRTQSAGRGTHGRTWVSTEGNLYAALRLDAGLMQAGLLAPQLVSACLLRVVKDLGVEAKLKWPNDLVINVPGKGWCKAAGILLERKGELLTAGIGLNLVTSPTAAAMREGAALPPASLAEILPASSVPDPLSFWENFLRVFLAFRRRFPGKPAPDLWVHELLWLNEPVTLTIHGTAIEGVLTGLNTAGEILIATPEGEKAFFEGSLAARSKTGN